MEIIASVISFIVFFVLAGLMTHYAQRPHDVEDYLGYDLVVRMLEDGGCSKVEVLAYVYALWGKQKALRYMVEVTG